MDWIRRIGIGLLVLISIIFLKQVIHPQRPGFPLVDPGERLEAPEPAALAGEQPPASPTVEPEEPEVEPSKSSCAAYAQLNGSGFASDTAALPAVRAIYDLAGRCLYLELLELQQRGRVSQAAIDTVRLGFRCETAEPLRAAVRTLKLSVDSGSFAEVPAGSASEEFARATCLAAELYTSLAESEGDEARAARVLQRRDRLGCTCDLAERSLQFVAGYTTAILVQSMPELVRHAATRRTRK